MAMDLAEKNTLELIDELRLAGDWPDPDLFRAITTRGTEAVAPLINVVTDDSPDTPAHYYACRLLGSIGDAAAIPALLGVMRFGDDEAIDDLDGALAQFGPPVIEPLLEMASDFSLDWYRRTCACQTALMAALDDTDLLAHVAKVMRGLLAKHISHAQTPLRDHYEMATFLVHYLTSALDPEAREVMQAAFDAEIVNTSVIAPDDVERDYREGKRRLRAPDPQKWLDRYTKRREEALRKAAMPLAAPKGPPPLDLGLRIQEKAKSSAKIGRNDRCWCGSGKKYKHCHLRSDTR
jgi:SEC-C motif-containing protein